MTTEKMTVYKALCELKILDSRIRKEIGNAKFSAAHKASANKVDGISVAEFQNHAKETYQAIGDLINRRAAIKSAVIESNATTKLDVLGETMSVAQAIEKKTSYMTLLDLMYREIERQYARANSSVTTENGNDLDVRCDAYIKALFGKEGTTAKAAEVETTRKLFMDANMWEIVDPIHSMDALKDYNTMKDKFLAAFDSALSVHNATTEIEITY